ncbi:MAG TPA: hypothetical protein VHF47_12530 [Acidimicrobiales bacterium]|nr:hypothetical protein [Acidimicrobiales bacterium]
MTKLRMLPAAGVAVVLLFVRADHVIGQPVEDCLLAPGVTAAAEPSTPVPTAVPPTVPAEVPRWPATVPTAPAPSPECGELLEGLVPTPSTAPAPEVPGVPPSDGAADVPRLPPVPAGVGCGAVDPGASRCTFTATGWLDVEVFAVIGWVDILDDSGARVGGFTGAGYDPPQLFGVVLPAEPGHRVVVRADSGWVVARNRSGAAR